MATCWYGSLKLHVVASPVAASICYLSVWVVIQSEKDHLSFCQLHHLHSCLTSSLLR